MLDPEIDYYLLPFEGGFRKSIRAAYLIEAAERKHICGVKREKSSKLEEFKAEQKQIWDIAALDRQN